ncbi:MAG TPA: hypothetical protein VHI71_01185 [Actinomycetota bacterium]|nr:hypothetical protein [Actinomycetota bacterium]
MARETAGPRLRRLLIVLAMVATLPAVALADDVVVEDPDDSAGRLDIKSVSVTHPDSGSIRYVITFYEPHGFTTRGEDDTAPADVLQIDLRLDGESPWRFKDILLYQNPDGGLYGVLRNHRGREISYVRAWRPDETSLAVEVRRLQLKRRELADRADWWIDVGYIDREVCPAEGGDVPASCNDSVPHFGFYRHDL